MSSFLQEHASGSSHLMDQCKVIRQYTHHTRLVSYIAYERDVINRQNAIIELSSATTQFGNPCAIIPPRGCLRSLPMKFQELIY